MPSRFAVFLIACLFSGPIWSAAALIVVPPGLEAIDGDSFTGVPFSTFPSFCNFGERFQQIYDGSYIGSVSIDGMWFRQDSELAVGPTNFTIPNVMVTLAHTTAPAGTAGGLFVENYEGGGTVVFAGDLTIDSDGVAAGKGVLPLAFDVEIPFQQSFQFDATHNLLVDIQIPLAGCAAITDMVLDGANDCCLAVHLNPDMAAQGPLPGGIEIEFGLVTQFAISTPGIIFNPGGYSGSWWFGPTHDGEGLLIEIIDVGGVPFIIVYWFTYDELGNQMWLVGIAEFSGFGPTIMSMELLTGPVFGPGYDPGDVLRTDFGTIAIEFFTPDTGEMTWASVIGFGAGTYDISRLTSILGNPGVDGSVKDAGTEANAD